MSKISHFCLYIVVGMENKGEEDTFIIQYVCMFIIIIIIVYFIHACRFFFTIYCVALKYNRPMSTDYH